MKNVACLFALCAISTAGAQSSSSSPQLSPPAVRSTATLVLVPALVHSTSGELIPGLKAHDFRLTANGVEQHLFLEQEEQQPLSILVLMQTGGAASPQFESYRKIAPMLDYMAGSTKHEAAVVTFDSVAEDMWPFTSETADLEEAFTKPTQGDSGAAVLDAVDYGIGLLSQRPPETRRILLLLSQPQDDGSKAHVENVVRRLGENNITIFSLTFSPEKTWLKDQFTKPRQGNPPYQLSPDLPAILGTFNLSTPLGVALKAMRGDTAAAIANLSGGEHIRFEDQHSLEQQLAVLASDLSSRYALSFHPSSRSPGFHSIQVEVIGRARPLAISARSGYWQASPESTQQHLP